MGSAVGLNISSWLKHAAEGGGRGQWLREWRKKGVGEVTIWLHTRAPIVPCFSHSFMNEDTYQDKDTGKSVPTLRFPRFNSPDPEIVHRNQYFREEDGSLQVPPDRDPFLLLREWLRSPEADARIGLDDPIFQWTHYKERKVIIWERGTISGLVKRGKGNFGHTLDTRIEYIYVVVDDSDVGSGPVLMREGKLLSQKILEVIKLQQKQFGDIEGDPTQHPYAFLCIAEDAAVPMNAFKAYKAEKAVFTDDVWEQIASEEFPDPVPYSQPGDGDMQKIRDAMQAAAQVDLPLDAIFSEDAQIRRDLTRRGPKLHTAGAPRQSKAAQARAAASPAERPPVPTNDPHAVPKLATAGRRKKVEPAAPPPQPEPEMIACEDCGHLMQLTDTKCGNCGAEYEVDAAPEVPPEEPAPEPEKPKTPPKPKPTTAGAKPTAAAAPAPANAKSTGGGARPRTRTKQENSQAEPPASDEEENACWACNAPVTNADRNADGELVCPSCGIEVGDDIPFAYNEVFVGLPFDAGIGERWHARRTNYQII